MQGWYDSNANRAYPFVEDAVGNAPGKTSGLPKSAIVDAGFMLGPTTLHRPGIDRIILSRITRTTDEFVFTFRSTADSMLGRSVEFRRPATATDWILAEGDTSEGASDSESADNCVQPELDGWLVTGDLTELAELMPSPDVWTAGPIEAAVETAAVLSLAGNSLDGLMLANADRTRAEPAEECDPYTWPYELGLIRTDSGCLAGPIAVRAGYNTVVRQEGNRITLAAVKGAGLGEPCEEIPLFAAEIPRDGSDLLDGGIRCNQVLRSINGVGGPSVGLASGPGVSVVPDPSNNRVIIDISLAGLPVLLPDGYSRVSDSL